MLKLEAGQVIKTVRHRYGKGQRELESVLGWGHGRLSKYENGSLSVSEEVMEEIAVALGIDREEILLEYLRNRYPCLSTIIETALAIQHVASREDRPADQLALELLKQLYPSLEHSDMGALLTELVGMG